MPEYLTLTMYRVAVIARDLPEVMDPEERVYKKCSLGDQLNAPEAVAQPLINLNAAPAHPRQAAAALPHAPGRENIPPIPTTPAQSPRPTLSPATLGPHNGQLSRHTPYQSEQTFAEEAAIPDWPFRGPEGPLQRTRIEGSDELVFGAF
ncbi:uncharacterized protein TRAVEDRAFT_22393 [Trametes versicolor FP-101664 SS1]|uniref:uncharacterized protein n=1 Tax=Trametes versicolor (strain FP-101664) TaxID=717944 RepID=UPI0004622B31|nr:uncharacterized protein TRAVEDRAFT_22393 [Trametes versicolor FP-101664 SS1]EIW56007.1 hypothetical protein TRAVEDRAFT_22393 [Trametes versicolor FP-101664 SS1]